MPNYADIKLVGHIGRDPELKFLGDGTPVLKFSLAVNTGYKDKKVCSWWECTWFGKRADTVSKFIHKGSAVLVSGEPQIREWDSNGKKGKSAEVRVNDIVLVGTKEQAQAPAADQQYDEAPPF